MSEKNDDCSMITVSYMLGYRVTTYFKPVPPEEARFKRSQIARVIAGSILRNKKSQFIGGQMSDQNLFWQKVKEILPEKIQTNDFSFLNGVVSAAFVAVTQEMLQFGFVQETFPDITGLSYYLSVKGHGPWKLTELKNKGLIANTVHGARGKNAGVWRMKPLIFKNLLQVPEDVADQPKKENHSPRLNGKRKFIWNCLQRELVGDRLLITKEHIDKIIELTHLEAHVVVHTLSFLTIGNMVEEGSGGYSVHSPNS